MSTFKKPAPAYTQGKSNGKFNTTTKMAGGSTMSLAEAEALKAKEAAERAAERDAKLAANALALGIKNYNWENISEVVLENRLTKEAAALLDTIKTKTVALGYVCRTGFFEAPYIYIARGVLFRRIKEGDNTIGLEVVKRAVETVVTTAKGAKPVTSLKEVSLDSVIAGTVIPEGLKTRIKTTNGKSLGDSATEYHEVILPMAFHCLSHNQLFINWDKYGWEQHCRRIKDAVAGDIEQREAVVAKIVEVASLIDQIQDLATAVKYLDPERSENRYINPQWVDSSFAHNTKYSPAQWSKESFVKSAEYHATKDALDEATTKASVEKAVKAFNALFKASYTPYVPKARTENYPAPAAIKPRVS